eukprot:TRINITY_DN30667_c0_g1_i1.p1 TRINITY_DN30667_c0_g1~~TRINITY_DN30667_c0_g1_i1.p1  ORF type:complete len:507 (+),score=58.69 TRINITY_DN30667_c0_g1_i1:58-1578(+)
MNRLPLPLPWMLGVFLSLETGGETKIQVSSVNRTIPSHDHRNKVFTARYLPHRVSWLELDSRDAFGTAEMQWDLLGLGLCEFTSGSRRWVLRRFREVVLSVCLLKCSVDPRCHAVSFSQSRGECIMGREVCSPDDLSKHVSFATFVPQNEEEHNSEFKLIDVGSSDRHPTAQRIYASSSPRVAPMLNAFLSSLRLAADGASLLLHEATFDDVPAITGPWPASQDDFVHMRNRDHRKINLLVKSVWDSYTAGKPSMVLSDVDVQVFPGWSELVTACTRQVHICLTLQPGMFKERSFPFNSGFIAVRTDATSVPIILDLAASYEVPFLMPANELASSYPLEQDVLSQHMFDRGAGLWAAFNPQVVSIFVDSIPKNFMRVKVQHACGSAAGSRLLSLYRTRRAYYSLFPLCQTTGVSGPQHPCCVIHGYQRTPFHSELPSLPVLPPFAVETLYSRDVDAVPSEAEEIKSILLSDDDQVYYWMQHCHDLRHERMGEWQSDNPEGEFLQWR